MQELKITMKSGQSLCVKSDTRDSNMTAEFVRFRDKFRLTEDSAAKQVFNFGELLLMIKLSEVAAVSFVSHPETSL